MPVGNDNASAFAHLEQRVSYLLERIETSTDPRANNLGRVEDALQDILRHLEAQHANLSAIADNSRQPAYTPPPMDSGIVDIVKRELSDIRFSQCETDRRTQDALETVHNTLGHVVDRLAMIEGDLRAARPHLWQRRPRADGADAAAMQMPEPPPAPSAPVCRRSRKSSVVEAPRMAMPPKPELPQPCRATGALRRRPARIPCRRAARLRVEPPPMPATPRAISEILVPHASAARRDRAGTAAGSSARAGHPAGPRMSSPSERIAASEEALGEIKAAPKEPVSTSSFIAAARRAAQAAAAAPTNDKTARKKAAQGQGAKDTPRTSRGRQGRRRHRRLEHHLEDPLAAGRRERGGDRARHLQDGDDAARHRSGAADAARWKSRRTASARRERRSPPCRAGRALDDLAGADRPAVEQFVRAEHARRRADHDPAGPGLHGHHSAGGRAAPINASDITGAIPTARRAPAGQGGRFGQVQVPPTEQTARRHRRTGAAHRCAEGRCDRGI